MKRWKLGIVPLFAAACSSSQPRHTAPTAPVAAAETTMFSKSDAYERFMGRFSRQLAVELVAFAGVEDGDAILDVGSGTGALAATIRDRTKQSRVVGIDPSHAYVKYAAARNQDPRVTFEVGDAQALAQASASFDKTIALLVMNFIPNRGAALDEMIRVTKPGGTVAAVVWDYGEGMELLRIFWDEAVAFDPSVEPADEKHMPLCKPGELSAMWKQHGLTNVQEAPLSITTKFASFEDFWGPFLLGQGPGGAYVAKLSRAKQAELAQRLRKRLLKGGPDRAFALAARAWAVKGTVAPK
ncbi:MAG TPA: class I SAM-dependent methyltransferase [Kofleriaceae bacterium]|nr:class I SAM-dependent methyltransferase [Kofleriaceae bacterium]